MKTKEEKIILDGHEIYYVVEKKSIKNIYFRVKVDMKLHVSCNRLVSDSQIKKLLEDNKEAIIKLFNHQQKKQVQGLVYLGEELTFIKADGVPSLENGYIYGPTMEACQKYLNTRALAVFNARLTQIKHQFNDLPEFTLKARKMTSRWGVCNKNSMSITLNTELITKEVHLIDYVIIHELCHFKHMNHSAEYWEYVGRYCPYYKRMRKELKY